MLASEPARVSSPATSSSPDAIIIGGGMVGLTLALQLAARHIRVLVLEATAYAGSFVENLQKGLAYQGSFDARNTALSRRTVEIYREMGIWDQLAQHATPIYEVHISEQNGFGKAYLHHQAEKIESFGYVIENAWLGQVLLKAVLSDPAISFADGATVTALQQAPQTASVTYNKNGEIQTLQAPLVIAADGRDSSIRNMLGVGAETRPYQQVALVTTVETQLPHQQIAYERFTANGPVALLPLPGAHRRSVVWTVRQGQESQWLGPENDNVFISTLEQAFGKRSGKITRTATRYAYPLMQVLADQQVMGRVVLMGNAAHTLHPVAGQGFNLCMRDAWALTAQVQKNLSEQKDPGYLPGLKAYEKSRLIDQKRVITFCDTVVRGFSNQNPVLKLTRNIGLALFETIPGVKGLVANYAMGLKF